MRQEITASRNQLRGEAKGRFPALLVLFDGTGGRTGAIASHDVLVAMYGEESVEYAVDVPPGTAHMPPSFKTGGNRGVDRNANTTVSAIAVLAGSVGALRLDVYHNCYAAIPLPPAWLQGGLVRHFAVTPWREGSFRAWYVV